MGIVLACALVFIDTKYAISFFDCIFLRNPCVI